MVRHTTDTPKGDDRQRNGNSKAVVGWRRRMKLKAIAYKGGKCLVCGYDRCARALAFHHLDPSEKEFSISAEGACRTWARVQAELDKCALLCGNCHEEVHAGLVDLQEHMGKNPSLAEGEAALRAEWPSHFKQVPTCPCGARISATAQRCVACALKAREKIAWPLLPELLALTEAHGFEGAGRTLGVTGTAIRRRLRSRS